MGLPCPVSAPDDSAARLAAFWRCCSLPFALLVWSWPVAGGCAPRSAGSTPAADKATSGPAAPATPPLGCYSSARTRRSSPSRCRTGCKSKVPRPPLSSQPEPVFSTGRAWAVLTARYVDSHGGQQLGPVTTGSSGRHQKRIGAPLWLSLPIVIVLPPVVCSIAPAHHSGSSPSSIISAPRRRRGCSSHPASGGLLARLARRLSPYMAQHQQASSRPVCRHHVPRSAPRCCFESPAPTVPAVNGELNPQMVERVTTHRRQIGPRHRLHHRINLFTATLLHCARLIVSGPCHPA